MDIRERIAQALQSEYGPQQNQYLPPHINPSSAVPPTATMPSEMDYRQMIGGGGGMGLGALFGVAGAGAMASGIPPAMALSTVPLAGGAAMMGAGAKSFYDGIYGSTNAYNNEYPPMPPQVKNAMMR